MKVRMPNCSTDKKMGGGRLAYDHPPGVLYPDGEPEPKEHHGLPAWPTLDAV